MLGPQAAPTLQLQLVSRFLVLASCLATAVVRVTPSDDLHANRIPISVSELATTVSLLSAELVQLRSDLARRAIAGTRPVTLFGAVCDGVTNDTAAFQLAVDSTSAGGMLLLPFGRCYLGAPVTIRDKAISIRGEGTGSVLVGDGDIIVGVNASFSQLSDFAIELRTQPWSFDLFSDTNDFLSLSDVMKTLAKSTDGQFSYSVNFNSKVPGLDQALRTEQKQQQEGLKVGLTFSRSDHVRIRGIFGTWATITIVDGSHCTVNECDIKGGNDALGTIVFIAGDNDVSFGLHNHAMHNTVRNGANSGIVLLRQKYTQLHGNTLIQVGESGLKTWQGNCCGAGGRSRRCYHVSAIGNTVMSSVYDGIDFNADYGAAAERVDDEPLAVYPWNELPTRHHIIGNMVLKPHGSAIWFDGIGTVVTGNTVQESEAGAILSVGSLNAIVGNAVHDANRGGYPTGNHGIASYDSTIVGNLITWNSSDTSRGAAVWAARSLVVGNMGGSGKGYPEFVGGFVGANAVLSEGDVARAAGKGNTTACEGPLQPGAVPTPCCTAGDGPDCGGK